MTTTTVTQPLADHRYPHHLTTLHVSTELGLRGGEQQVIQLTEGLLARGHRVILACPAAGQLNANRTALLASRPDLASSLELVDYNPRGPLDLRAAYQLAGLISTHRPDVVHAHTSHAHSQAWLTTWLPCARRGWAPTPPPIVVSRRVDFAISRSLLGRAKYLSPALNYIAISHAVADVLRAGGVPADRVSVVHSGIDPDRFGGPRTPEIAPPRRDDGAAARWGAPAGVPLLLNVAALVDHKDHATLLDAAAHLRDAAVPFHLVIAGDGELRPALEAQIAALDLAAHVTLAGRLADPDLRELHRAADLFVLSSHLEGLGTAVLDALAVGLPVVATRTGGVPESVIPDRTGWLVPPRDPAALAAAIQTALAAPPARAILSNNGPLLVHGEFTNDAMVEGTLAVYRSLLRPW